MRSRDIVQYIAEKRDEVTNTTYILYSPVSEDVVAAKPGIVRCVLGFTVSKPWFVQIEFSPDISLSKANDFSHCVCYM